MKKTGILLFLILLIQSGVIGQSLDSLMALLSKADSLSRNQVAAVSLEIARSHANAGKYQQSLTWLERVMSATDDSLLLSKAYRVKGQVSMFLHRLEDVKDAVRMSNCYRPKIHDPHEVVVCNNLLGLICAVTGDYGGGFEYFYRSLLLREKANDGEGIGLALTNLGFNYYKLCDYRMATKYFLLANERPQDAQNKSILFSNLALAYAHLDSPAHALKWLGKLQRDHHLIQKSNLMLVFYGYGIAYQKLSLYDSAGHYFRLSLALSDSVKDTRLRAENLVSLATIAVISEDLNRASWLLDEAEVAAAANSNHDILLRIYKQKILLAKRRENQIDLIAAHDQYIQRKSGLYNPYLVPIVAASKARFYEKEYQDAIRLHRELLSQNAQQNNNLLTLGYMQVAIIFLSITLIALLIVSFATRKAHATRLEETIQSRIIVANKKVHNRHRILERSTFLLALSEEVLDSASRRVIEIRRSTKKLLT